MPAHILEFELNKLSLSALLVSGSLSLTSAHAADDYPIDFFPDLPFNGITQLRFIGPEGGRITNTHLSLNFTTMDGFDAVNFTILLAGRVIPDTPDTGFIFLTGADLGWSGQGTFTADVDFPDMNGEIVPGLWLFDLGSTLEPPAWAGQFSADSRWTLTIEGLPVPCRPDINNDGALNSQDFFDFLTQFFEGAIDYNTDDAVNSQDFFDFLSDFFQGCGT